MKILFYFTYLLFSTINVNICTNDVYDSDVKLSGEDRALRSYPIKRKAPSYDDSYDVNSHEEQHDAQLNDKNFLNVQPNQRYRRIGDSSITGLSNEQENGERLRSTRVIKRSFDDQQSKEPYGLVYRKGRLLGILEPYPEVYELSPYSSVREGVDQLHTYPAIQSEDVQYLSNRMGSLTDVSDDSEKDESSQNDFVPYANDKYPMILTSFKIDKKLSALNANKHERTSLRDKIKERHSIRDKYSTDVKSSDTKSALSKEDEEDVNLNSEDDQLKETETSDKVDAIEDDLHDILDDIGLIDKDLEKDKRNSDEKRKSEKRDTNNEDENLEEGSNKIDIVKATHDPEKSEKKKREEEYIEDDAEFESQSTSSSVSENEPLNKENIREVPSDIQNYQSEGEEYIRNKRNEVINENIMKGLEKSGELTVSGNKSPLASSENESKTVEKRKNSENSPNESKKNDDYERQLELNIQQKINAIKEEVKREIALLQAKTALQVQNVEDSQRRKREVGNTLLNGQLKAINPQDQPEGFLIPYIRTKRNSEKSSRRSKRHLGKYESVRNFDNNEDARDNNSGEDSSGEYATEKSESRTNSESGDTLMDDRYENLNASSKSDDKRCSELRRNCSKREDSNASLQEENLVKRQRQTDVGVDSKKLKMQRKRRQIDFLQNTPIISYLRKKRGEAVMPDGNIAYLPYRAEDDEVDEEGDEFDDDGFDDRSAGMHKRDIDDNQDYQSVVDYDMVNNYGVNQMQRLPRKYIANLNSDVYERSLQDLLSNNYLYDPSVHLRKKRHAFEQLVALHGGGPMVHHLSAVRDRNMRQLENEAAPEHQQASKLKHNIQEEQQNIVDLTDTDLFGALPQSYEGELSRIKRVKRSSLRSPTKGNRFASRIE